MSEITNKQNIRKRRGFGGLKSWARLTGLSLTALFALATAPSHAQQSLRIAAIVNDEMISVLDLRARIALVAAFSGFENTPETQNRLAPQVLQTLIEERIRLQEAKKREITAKKREIDAEKSDIEKQTNTSPGELTKSLIANGINPATLLEQLESRIVWTKLVRRRYRRDVRISDAEVDEVIEEIKRNKGKPENLVSEIFLPADTQKKAAEASKLATQLIQQIQSGANFASIARNFSRSTSAQNGGNLGWNRIGQLGSDLDPIIQRLKPGQITNPVQTADGVYILKLHDRRASRGLEGPPPGPAEVKLQQIHLTIPEPKSPTEVADTKARIQSLTSTIKGCQAFSEVAKQSGSDLSGELGTFSINQISTQMRALVIDLPVGQASLPQVSGDGVIALMVCGRKVPKEKPIDLEKIQSNIRNDLIGKRLSLAARRYMRDLRRSSFIEIRQ